MTVYHSIQLREAFLDHLEGRALDIAELISRQRVFTNRRKGTQFLALATVALDRLRQFTDQSLSYTEASLFRSLEYDECIQRVADEERLPITAADIMAAATVFESFCQSLMPGIKIHPCEIALGFKYAIYIRLGDHIRQEIADQ